MTEHELATDILFQQWEPWQGSKKRQEEWVVFCHLTDEPTKENNHEMAMRTLVSDVGGNLYSDARIASKRLPKKCEGMFNAASSGSPHKMVTYRIKQSIFERMKEVSTPMAQLA